MFALAFFLATFVLARAQQQSNVTLTSSTPACTYATAAGGQWIVGSDHQTLTAGDEVQCTFTGTAVYFVAQVCGPPTLCVPANSGNYAFDVDGASLGTWTTPNPLEIPPGAVNGFPTVVYAATGLPNAQHVLTAENLVTGSVLWFLNLVVTTEDQTVVASSSAEPSIDSSSAPPSTSEASAPPTSEVATTSSAAPTSSATAAGAGSDTASAGSSSSTNVGAIAGGVVAGVAVLLLIILAIFCVRRRSKRQRLNSQSPDTSNDHLAGGGGNSSFEKAQETAPPTPSATAQHQSDLPYLEMRDEAAAAGQPMVAKRSVKRKPVPRVLSTDTVPRMPTEY